MKHVSKCTRRVTILEVHSITAYKFPIHECYIRCFLINTTKEAAMASSGKSTQMVLEL
jgi:hypothetical protein